MELGLFDFLGDETRREESPDSLLAACLEIRVDRRREPHLRDRRRVLRVTQSIIGVNFPPEFDRLRETDAIVSVDVSTRRNQASGLIGRSLTVRSLRIKSRFIGGRGENSRVFN